MWAATCARAAASDKAGCGPIFSADIGARAPGGGVRGTAGAVDVGVKTSGRACVDVVDTDAVEASSNSTSNDAGEEPGTGGTS